MQEAFAAHNHGSKVFSELICSQFYYRLLKLCEQRTSDLWDQERDRIQIQQPGTALDYHQEKKIVSRQNDDKAVKKLPTKSLSRPSEANWKTAQFEISPRELSTILINPA